ncbi:MULTISPECIES: hypothetical protein [unclassified Paenibacillus]|uniref:hypothetical protein n=1 Tax=unclassified Paenibacillus TaxID=185978 RepID=UPI0009A5DFC6|nr:MULTISPECIES: hypothetical protein [unclassified Paenibacillus]SLJ98337.1 hypothetical protein SAMN06272722_102734 [Paenibacillus sp. RU5A]SOC66781.1 hypothetical protein SAMN05880581_102263 [Paenibacillus sp. RU26A]SOC70070.1 hypothetical protein SAMN05880586_102734 [Paenibacillus sp. RU5M]
MQLNCTKDLIMKPDAIAGKSYKVIWIDEEEVCIRNENRGIHYFSTDPAAETYYGHWFDLVE